MTWKVTKDMVQKNIWKVSKHMGLVNGIEKALGYAKSFLKHDAIIVLYCIVSYRIVSYRIILVVI